MKKLIFAVIAILFAGSVSGQISLSPSLFYSLPWGEGQLVSHQQFYIIPSSIILIALLNLMIIWQLPLAFGFLKKILVFSTNVTAVILTVTFIKIVLIFL